MILNANGRIKKHFPYKHNSSISGDFIFIYPEDGIREKFDLEETKDILQCIIEFIRDVMGLNLKNQEFDSKIVVGYRRDEDLELNEINPSWVLDNTIKLPWGYLKNRDQPIEACTHELVHPFFYVSELNKDKEASKYRDVFCDFLRIKIGEYIKFKKNFTEIWLKELKEKKNDWEQHGRSLRLLAEFKQQYKNKSKDKENLEQFIRFLFKNAEKFCEKIAKPITEEEIKWIVNLLSKSTTSHVFENRYN